MIPVADNYEITDSSKIEFHDLFKGEEEDGFMLVGRRDIGFYVSLPLEGIELIDLLDSGKTIGEVKKILKEKYEEEIEIKGFIKDMITNEMVKRIDDFEVATTSRQQKDLFNRITGKHVGWMFSKYAWVVYIGMAVSCLIIFALVPGYIPRPRDFFFHSWYSVAVGFMFFFGWILIVFHEFAHLFAAKSMGIEGNFSLSNRLFFVVVQTDVSNIWTVPREKRYTVYFAGMAWDTVMIFVCLLLLLLSDKGLVTLPTLWYNFLKAVIFVRVWGIIWQFRFNMKTDIYYVVGNYFRGRDLMVDAQTYIKNILSGFWNRIKKVDMSSILGHEMRAIKFYASLYLLGTSVMLATYFLRDIPILMIQVTRAIEGITIGYNASPADFIDAVILVALTVSHFGVLGYLVMKPRWNRLKQWIRLEVVQK